MGKVAILIPCLLTGGTEVVTLETATAFRALGYSAEVVVYFNEVDSVMLHAFERDHIAVRQLHLARRGGLIGSLRLALALFGAMQGQGYSFIWVQYLTPTLVPLLLARLFSRRLVAVVHVAATHYSSSSLRRLQWLAHHWCARFVCVSNTAAKGIFGFVSSPEWTDRRVVVIPNSLDMRVVESARAWDWRGKTDWPAGTVVVGFVGRLAHIKGADTLLHAVAHLHSKSLPVRLVVVGVGDEMTNLQALSHQLNIGEITHFAGRIARANIYSAIKGFDIVAVPSREEGFGLSSLEAMACGVPVVASRVDALQEVVQDGVTGLLCQANDPISLADALLRFMSDPALRRRMGTSGAAHARNCYDIPAYRAHLSDLLASLEATAS